MFSWARVYKSLTETSIFFITSMATALYFSISLLLRGLVMGIFAGLTGVVNAKNNFCFRT